MRTNSRWSKSARSWECRSRSWTSLCFYQRPRFKRTFCERRRRDHAKPPHSQKRRGSTTKVVNPIFGRIIAPKLPNIRYQKLQQTALPDRSSSKCRRQTTCSTALPATLSRAPDAKSTSPIMSSKCTTPFLLIWFQSFTQLMILIKLS